MAVAVKVLAWLVSVVVLIVAGLLAGCMIVPKAELSVSIWLLAGFAVLLAFAINPPLGKRNVFAIAGVIVVAVASVLTALNYDYWRERRRLAMMVGLSDQVQNMTIHVALNVAPQKAVNYGYLRIDAPQVTAYPPFRVLTTGELKARNDLGDNYDKPRASLDISRSADDISHPTMAVRLTVLVAQPSLLHAPKDEFANHDYDAARKYLLGGKVVLTTKRGQLVWLICSDDIEDLSINSGGDVALGYYSNVFLDVCPDPDRQIGVKPSAAVKMRVATFVAAMTASDSVRMDMYGAAGQLVATTIYPTAAYNDALQRENRMMDKLRKGDVGEPFSLFHFYAP